MTWDRGRHPAAPLAGRRVIGTAFCLSGLYGLPTGAWAQTTAEQGVTIEWGGWLAYLLAHVNDALVAVVLAVTGIVIAQLPGWVRPVVYTLRVEQLIRRAVEQSLARITTSLKADKLTIGVADDVVRHALEFILANGAPKVLAFLGDELPPLIMKILARMGEQGVQVPKYDPVTAAGRISDKIDVNKYFGIKLEHH